MSRNAEHDDVLDWTLADAPSSDETPPTLPLEQSSLAAPRVDEQRRHLHLSRRTGMLLGGSIVLAMLGVALVTLQNRWQTEAEINRVIALEEQAARNQDLAALSHLLDPQPPGWMAAQASWLNGGQLSPLPDLVLRPKADTPSVTQSITQVTTDTMRAEVVRTFITPDGQRLKFLFAQFYRYMDNGWRRTAVPPNAWGDTRDYIGERLTLTFPAVDAAFALEAGAFINTVLTQACEQWKCPSDFSLQLTFVPETPNLTIPIFGAMPSDEPLVFAHLRFNSGDEWEVPSPRAVGYPADTASADWLKRSLAVQALIHLANERVGFSRHYNAYLYALVARQSTRLGLDPFKAISVTTAPSLYYPDELWDLPYAGLWADPPQRAEALRAGLAQLNRLLTAPGLPADAEMRLSDEILTTFHSDTWLATALRLTPDVAAVRLNEAAVGAFHFTPPAALPDIVLSCPTGPAMFYFGAENIQPIWRSSENGRAAYITLWSPSGEWVAMGMYENAMTLNLVTGEVRMLPHPLTDTAGIQLWPFASVGDSVLAYQATYWDAASNYHPTLYFSDLADPLKLFAPVTGVVGYFLSPDQTQAAITEPLGTGQRLSLMPPLGGPRTVVGRTNNAVAWSPDSRELAYLTEDADGFTVHSYDVAAHTSRLLWQSDSSIRTRGANQAPSALVFSPDGRWLAFMRAIDETIWLVRLARDGTSQMWPQKDNFFSAPAFSADGLYLAATTYDNEGNSRTAVYETTTNELVSEWSGVWGVTWSPTGHELLTFGYAGVKHWSGPGAEPQIVTEEQCANGLWRPNP